MRIDYEGRGVVVTGATGELGHAVVEALVEAGARCHLPVRRAASAERLKRLDASRVSLTPDVDITHEASVGAYYRGLPSIWASVHCAGAFAMAPFADTSLEDFQKMMTVNAVSAFLCSREAVRRLRENPPAEIGAGRIVNVAAIPAVEPRRGAGMSAYAASKAVVAALTQAVAEEVKPLGIWVNAVAPSIMDTPANRKGMPGADFAAWPKVDEVAGAIVFLASPQNRSVRGAVAPVFGKT